MQQTPDFDVIRGFQIEGTDPTHRALIPNLEPVKHLLVFLHGYGADADDLFPLAMQMAPALPATAIVSLEAPEEIPGGMLGGRQWFPISRIDKSELDHGAQMARGYVNTALQSLKRRFDLQWSDIALFGFSQGCMMSLEVSLRLPEALGYVLGYSGALPAPERAATEARHSRLICWSTAKTIRWCLLRLWKPQQRRLPRWARLLKRFLGPVWGMESTARVCKPLC